MGQKDPLPCSGAAICSLGAGGPTRSRLPADPPRATPLSLLASRGCTTITVNLSQRLISHFTLRKMGKLFKWDH